MCAEIFWTSDSPIVNNNDNVRALSASQELWVPVKKVKETWQVKLLISY